MEDGAPVTIIIQHVCSVLQIGRNFGDFNQKSRKKICLKKKKTKIFGGIFLAGG
jgi:hypothetical protein